MAMVKSGIENLLFTSDRMAEAGPEGQPGAMGGYGRILYKSNVQT